MEKSCKNCRKNRCDAVTFTLCMDPEPYKDWQPDYQTLEAQLAKANALIIEQIEQIAKERAELERYKEALRLACEAIIDLEMNYDGYSVDIKTQINNFLTKAKGD